MTDCLIVADLHLADRAPSSRRETYAAEILLKLRWCMVQANGYGVPLVIAGDVFHVKTPWRTSYHLIQQTHDVLREVDHGVWIVSGNHDVSGDRLASLDSQPLGALCRMGNVHMLTGFSDQPGLPGIAGIPWLREFDGGDWVGALKPWLDTITEQQPPELVVTHAPLFPEGREPGVYASIPSRQWAEIMQRAGIWATYYGHIHESHGEYGFYDEKGGHALCNNGALSRGSLHEESIKRRVAATLWRARKFERLELSAAVVLPAEEVFLFEEAAQGKERAASAQAFTDALGAVKLANLTVEEVIAYIRLQDPDPDVMRTIEECLEVAG